MQLPNWHKHSKKWHVQIQYNKIKIHLGYFDCLDEAKKIIEKARKQYHGEFAKH